MDEQFIIVTKKQKGCTEITEGDGKYIIQQSSGLNTDGFTIKKSSGKQLKFSFFKINGIYFLALNDDHICDYKKFTHIEKITIHPDNENDVLVKNTSLGEFKLKNCDVDIIRKAMKIMHEYIKPKRNIIKEFFEFLLT